MADVVRDTPIGVFGIPSGLIFDERPVLAYVRLSPFVPGGRAWWERLPVVNVPLPTAPASTTRGDGTWTTPRFPLVATPNDVHGLVTWQSGVNGAYVKELAGVAGATDVPWGPLCLVQIDDGMWLVDGNHRAAASALAARANHPARVANIASLVSCPCGWHGHEPGGWLAHPCPQMTRQGAGEETRTA